MRDQNVMRRLLSGILLIILVHEWLNPLSKLSEWTSVYSVTPLLFTIAGIVAVDVLSIHPIWSWLTKLFIILSSVAAMFHGTNLFHLEWWVDFAILIRDDSLHMITADWVSVSAEGRTLLFIGAWSTVVCWLYAVILYQRVALYVTMFTVVYLIILQTWLSLDTTIGVVITIITGLCLHGLSVLPGLESTFGLKAKLVGWPIRWVMSSIVLVSLTVGCGLLLSMGQEKATLKLPQSLMSWNWQSLGTFSFPGYRVKPTNLEMKSGYSLMDSELGGSVSTDDSIAFLANTERPDAYWRGESKSVYDGKGWSNLKNDLYGYEIGSMLPDVLMDGNASILDEKTFIQEVFPQADYPSSEQTTILLSSGAIRRIEKVNIVSDTAGKKLGPITMDRVEGKYTLQGSGSSSLSSYSVKSSAPITSDRAKLVLGNMAEGGPVPAEISIPNVKLPDTLPERVSQLAHTITDEFDSTWEKANAIEQYLHDHYRYTLTPKSSVREGDFVDQFLFELQEGYCDYFSTAMAVMLRSIGVPARWVKGFAPGEIIHTEENDFLQESAERLQADEIKTYSVMVRNRNAHSWVEVYITGIGWTSFDPTPTSLAALAQVSEVGEANKAKDAKEATRYYLLKLISSIWSTLLNKWLQTTLVWIAATVLIGQALYIFFTAKLVRYGLRLIYIRLLLFQYRWGMATSQADTRLSQRVLGLIFSRYGHSMEVGETVRESVMRGYFPDEVLHELLVWVSIYERARYSPAERRRIPYESIITSWRMLN